LEKLIFAVGLGKALKVFITGQNHLGHGVHKEDTEYHTQRIN